MEAKSAGPMRLTAYERTIDYSDKDGRPWSIHRVVMYACCVAGWSKVAKRIGVTERTVRRWLDEPGINPRGADRIRERLSRIRVDADGVSFK